MLNMLYYANKCWLHGGPCERCDRDGHCTGYCHTQAWDMVKLAINMLFDHKY